MRLMSARGTAQPEQPRPRISRLRPRRDRAHFDVTEAERAQRIEVVAVLVETGRQADRMREAKAEQVDVEAGEFAARASSAAAARSPRSARSCAVSGGSRCSTGSAAATRVLAAAPAGMALR